MMRRIMMLTGTKKKTVIATAIATLFSATAAFVAIKITNKAGTVNGHLKREDKSEFETVLNGLVEAGTINEAQQVAIQIALITAKEASTVNDDLMRDETVEVTTVPGSSKTGTLTRLTNSLFNAPQNKNL